MHLYEFTTTTTTTTTTKLLLLPKLQPQLPHLQKQDRQCIYNVTLRHVCATTVAAEQQ